MENSKLLLHVTQPRQSTHPPFSTQTSTIRPTLSRLASAESEYCSDAAQVLRLFVCCLTDPDGESEERVYAVQKRLYEVRDNEESERILVSSILGYCVRCERMVLGGIVVWT
jgi:hypothetical protein